jgi:phosphatidate cytidylyltransferase
VGEFGKRALTGAAYVALTLGAAIVGPFTTWMLFLPVCLIGAQEWHRLYWGESEDAPSLSSAVALAAMVYLTVGIVPMVATFQARHAAILVFGLLILLVFMLLRSGTSQPARVFSFHLGTALYVALPFAAAPWMVAMDCKVFIGFMFLLWTSDTGAYLVGRSVGRTKLMPAVSPGKTWEGLAGGVALTMLVGWLLGRYWTVLSPQQWIAGAAAVAITATLGDLLESAFKRAAGVKDSGTVLPGHGGILDRFDGYLLAAPAMMLVIQLLA